MAIAYDATAQGTALPGTSITFAHTCTGDDGLLLVGVQCQDDTVTGVTYNGTAMTQLKKVASAAAETYMYGLLAPTTGAHNVVVSISASKYCRAISASYTGVLQTGLPDATSSVVGTDTVTSQALSTTTVLDQCWVAVMTYSATTSTATTAGTGGYLRNNIGALHMFMDSNSAVTPAGAYSETANFNANAGERAMVGVSFAPVPATSGGNFFQFL
jgi:hypothetical protein